MSRSAFAVFGDGGAGSVGRVWIGFDTIDVAGGSVDGMPGEVAAPGGKAATFPR